jgi:hypothetical protein
MAPVDPPVTGYGVFEYQSGAKYEGEWMIVEGVKKRHGRGRYTHPPPVMPKLIPPASRVQTLRPTPALSDTTTNRGSAVRLNTAGSTFSIQSQLFPIDDQETASSI